MKNILGTTEDLRFYNKDGKRAYGFKTDSNGYSYEFTFDKYGNTLTYRNSKGYSYECTRDESGKELTYKDSNNYSLEYTRDENGKELTFKDSHGIERGFEIPEFTMEELTQKIGNFKLIK